MSSLLRYDILLGASTLLFGLAFSMWYTGKKHLPYPPGPKRLPIVGNLFSLPSREEWVTYRKWSKEAGMARDAIILYVSNLAFVRFRCRPYRCNGVPYHYSQLHKGCARAT